MILLCASTWRQRQLQVSRFRVCSDYVTPPVVIRDLGVYLNSDVSIRSRAARTVSHCFGVLRQLGSIRLSLSHLVLQSVVSLVSTALDYDDATLAGIPSFQLRRLQAVGHQCSDSTCVLR